MPLLLAHDHLPELQIRQVTFAVHFELGPLKEQIKLFIVHYDHKYIWFFTNLINNCLLLDILIDFFISYKFW